MIVELEQVRFGGMKAETDSEERLERSDQFLFDPHHQTDLRTFLIIVFQFLS